MKTFVLLTVIAAVVVSTTAKANHVSKYVKGAAKFGILAQGDELDPSLCVGRFDENVYHPEDCTKFVACTNQRSIEMDCGDCNTDIPGSCLRGKLVFSLKHGEPHRGQCVHAYESECTETPPTTQEPTDPPTTEDPRECDPELCENFGDCKHYWRCDKQTATLVREECGEKLYWNPDGSGSVHGGNCDYFKNLSPAVQKKYRSDPECLQCYWKEKGECQQEYFYQAPGLDDPEEQTLSCANGLVFSLAKETCQRCEDVDRADGSPCC